MASNTSTGQCEQHVTGKASLGREDLHRAVQLDAATDQRADLVEHFGEVATNLALNKNCRDEQTHVQHVNTLGKVAERVFHLETEVLLVKDTGELGAGRFRDFLGNQLHGAGQRITGPQRLAEQLKNIGKLVDQLVQTLLAASVEVQHGQHEHGNRRTERCQRWCMGQ